MAAVQAEPVAPASHGSFWLESEKIGLPSCPCARAYWSTADHAGEPWLGNTVWITCEQTQNSLRARIGPLLLCHYYLPTEEPCTVLNSSFVEIYVSPTSAISACITKTTLASVVLGLHLQTPRFTFLFSIHKQAVSTSSREDKTYNRWIKRCSEGGDNALKDKHFFQKEGKNLDQVWHFHAAGRQLQHNLRRGDSPFQAVYQLVWGKICWCTWNESGKKCQPLLTLFPHVNNFTDY